MPMFVEFNPDLVLVSAGYDAGRGDPLGKLSVDPEAYSYMSERLLTLAEGNLVFVLEGGYNLNTLSMSCEATLRTLLG